MRFGRVLRVPKSNHEAVRENRTLNSALPRQHVTTSTMTANTPRRRNDLTVNMDEGIVGRESRAYVPLSGWPARVGPCLIYFTHKSYKLDLDRRRKLHSTSPCRRKCPPSLATQGRRYVAYSLNCNLILFFHIRIAGFEPALSPVRGEGVTRLHYTLWCPQFVLRAGDIPGFRPRTGTYLPRRSRLRQSGCGELNPGLSPPKARCSRNTSPSLGNVFLRNTYQKTGVRMVGFEPTIFRTPGECLTKLGHTLFAIVSANRMAIGTYQITFEDFFLKFLSFSL